MRISDWSSDVCSSDLGADIGAPEGARPKDRGTQVHADHARGPRGTVPGRRSPRLPHPRRFGGRRGSMECKLTKGVIALKRPHLDGGSMPELSSVGVPSTFAAAAISLLSSCVQIGREHVSTTVTNAHLLCLL